MGLHNALSPEMLWIWRFYTAVNERRGRAHLLHIPYAKRLILHPPSWYTEARSQGQWIRRERNLGDLWTTPLYVFLQNPRIDKYCNRAQRAKHYIPYNYWHKFRDWTMPMNGICPTCHEYALSLPDIKTMGPSTYDIWRSAGSIEEDTNVSQWIRYAQGYRDG